MTGKSPNAAVHGTDRQRLVRRFLRDGKVLGSAGEFAEALTHEDAAGSREPAAASIA
ncbi:hypothetical protein LCGC14_2885820, partial [marine sediment metagenome]